MVNRLRRVAHTWPDAEPTWRSVKSHPMESAAVRIDHGKEVKAYSASVASAPVNAARFEARIFEFSPYIACDIRLSQGVSLSTQSTMNRLMLLLAGHAIVMMNG